MGTMARRKGVIKIPIAISSVLALEGLDNKGGDVTVLELVSLDDTLEQGLG